MNETLNTSKTLLDYFYEFEKDKANEVYLKQPIDGVWKTYTWAEVGQQVRSMAAALKAMDLPPNSHIGILSKNCAHWIMADLAIMMSGHVSVPFYATLTAESLKEVLTLSNTKVLFLGKLETWEQQKAGLLDDIHCITFPHHPGNSEITGYETWDDLVANNAPLTFEYYPTLEDLYTIIYTSGTTGTPKGVMLDYGAVARLLENERQSNMLKLFEGNEHRFFFLFAIESYCRTKYRRSGKSFDGRLGFFCGIIGYFCTKFKRYRTNGFLGCTSHLDEIPVRNFR